MPRETPTEGDRAFHTRSDPHGRAARLADVILGGQDGLVNTLGVILGVAAATSDLFFFATRGASIGAVVVAVAVLFSLGAFAAKLTVGRPIVRGATLALIGTCSAMLGYAIGLLFRVPTVG